MGVVQLSKTGNLTGSFFDEIFPSNGLVSYWPLDGNGSDVGVYNNTGVLSHGSIIYAHYLFSNGSTDSSSNGYTLTGTAVNFGPGKLGSAAYFNGTTSFLTRASGISVTSRAPQTICAWVKPDSLTNQGTITSYNGSCGFSIKTTGVLEIDLPGSSGANGGGQIRSGSVIPTGSWTHVTAVIYSALPTNQGVDVRDADLYINGSLTAKTLTLAPSDNTAAATIFNVGGKNSTTNLFAGSIDDLRVYPTVLDSIQIGSIYNNGVGTENEIADIIYTTSYLGSCMTVPCNALLNMQNPTSLQFGSSNSFTFSLWAYPYRTSTKTATGLFNRSFIAGLDIGAAQGSTCTYRFGVRLGGTVVISTSPAYLTNTWHHVVGVHDAAAKTVQVFVDGSAHTAASFLTLNWVNGGVLALGGTQVLSGNSTAYNGLIDDVRVYNRALGSAEIKQMYLNRPYFTSSSGVFSREFVENQSLGGSVKMRMNNNNSIYIVNELVEN